MTPGHQQIRDNRGIAAKLARELGITAAAVSKWQRIPAERVLDVERVTGISRSALRPDLYPREGIDVVDTGAGPPG